MTAYVRGNAVYKRGGQVLMRTHSVEFEIVIAPNQPEVSAKDFSVMVSAAFPGCQIDWEAGDAITRRNIAYWEGLGAPEVLLMGEKNHLGKRFEILLKVVFR